ncbi:MAG: tetratricopeptide repeat protein [Planctomycetes bacterium]|nr:tetratricopeptide repeat protein [Planctomycetota bacterium]
MDPAADRDALVPALIAEALARFDGEGPDAVEALLREHPDLAPTVRRKLDVLLDHGMLDGRPAAGGAIPERIGEFLLRRRLGAGGMGVVYLAEQPSLGRHVALKLVRPEHLLFPQAHERFRREVAAIAGLQHPGIVRVYSASVDDELPYFTMECIEGASLDRLLARVADRPPGRLTEADARAALAALGGGEQVAGVGPHPRGWVELCSQWLRELADAVAYAHRQGVLHRDLKPSNVMITWSLRAVLLDFGLARTESSGQLTRSGAVLGSLPYMAPEQIRGERRRVGQHTDVYGLGLLFYELLTLRNPFQEGAGSDDEIRRRILAAAPPPARQQNPSVSWDAETVCHCAIAPEPERRYDSAASLVEDLDNLLHLLPIAARRAGSLVRMRRWVRRRPTLTAALSMGLLLVVVTPTAIAISEFELRQQVTQAKDEVTRESEARAEILEFFRDELLGAVALDQLGKDATMRQALDVAATKIEGRFTDRPLVEATIRSTIGFTYLSLGVLDAAELHLERSLALYTQHAGADDPETLGVTRRLSMVYSAQGNFTAEEALLRRNLVTSRRLFGDDDGGTLAAGNNLGLLLTNLGRDEEALAILRDVLERRLRLLGEQDEETQITMSNLGIAYYNLGRFAEAEPLVRRELELCSARLGDDDPSTLISRHNYANLLSKMGRVEAGLAEMQRVLDASRRTCGERHFNTLNAMVGIAKMQLTLARPQAAEPMAREILRCGVDLAPDHPNLVIAHIFLADALRMQGHLAAARHELEPALDQCRAEPENLDGYLPAGRVVEASLLVAEGRREDAAHVYADTVAGWSGKAIAPLARLRLDQARNLRALGRETEAETALRRAHVELTADAVGAAGGELLGEVFDELVELCVATGRGADAAGWRDRREQWRRGPGADAGAK